jgi:nucleoid DNA-binding protein
MRKKDLAREVARKTGVTRGEAADQVDRVVNTILHKLRSGESAKLPGFGQFRNGPDGKIEFREERGVNHARGGDNE